MLLIKATPRLMMALPLAAALPGAARAGTRTEALSGVTLPYVDTGGTGPALVFVHALTGTSASWANQVAFFSAKGFRGIAFDRRGWGDSIPDPAMGSQPASVAEDIEALVARLDVPRFHLVGIAGGGFVALDYAAWKPERLRSLVVVASTGAVSETEILDFSRRIEIPGVTWPRPPRLAARPRSTARRC